MKTLLLAAALALGLLSAPPAQSQARVGLLWIESDQSTQILGDLREALREQGFVDGRTVSFEQRTNVTGYESLADAAAELVRLKVQVIVCWGDTATRAAAKATSTIPIVMLTANDPVAAGLATSLARPGGNVTGVASLAQELVAKRLQLLKDIVPRAKRIGVLLNPASKGEIETLKHSEVVALLLGLQLYPVDVGVAKDIETAIARAARAGVGALTVVPSTMLRANRVRIAEAAAANRLPTMLTDASYVESGGLISYGRESSHAFRLVADYVAKILNGAKPGDLSIQQPTKFELVVNLKTAKVLGIKIPQGILLRADKVIE